MSIQNSPLDALRFGQWFKLICGASYHDVSRIRNLSLVYSLAGADCIDVAADLAVVNATKEGMAAAQAVLNSVSRPWLMVSFNDGQDPHFRKAWFDPQQCPSSCSRPCERICPASAIGPTAYSSSDSPLGVMTERCYGCGRCLPICPYGLIEDRSFRVAVDELAPVLLPHIDAIEIHTHMGRQASFQRLWQQLASDIPALKLVAVSCPDSEPGTNAIVEYLAQLYRLMKPKPAQLLWQTDGRSMSGDIGNGTTHATIRLGQKVLNARLPGYVQLAGGTNNYTVAKLRSLNLLKTASRLPHQSEHQLGISGVAYGSYARQLVNLDSDDLEKQPEHLWQQVRLARELVGQIKPEVHHNVSRPSELKPAYQQTVATVPP